jgi:hypothetical protein
MLSQVFPLAAQLHATVMPAIHTVRTKLLAADVLFKIPVWKHYMSVGECECLWCQFSAPAPAHLKVALSCWVVLVLPLHSIALEAL